MIPATASLDPGDPGLQLLVEGKGPGGGVRDVTGDAAWTVEPPGILVPVSNGYFRPIGPGKATIEGKIGDEVIRAEVQVQPEPAAGRSWDFATDIVPLLTRAGCNTGGCHGKADGQNGFHLSLFGYDPEGDYQAIVREAGGRRLLRFDPEESLLMRKATGRTPHGGGQRIVSGTDAHRVLLRWIADGAPERKGLEPRKLTKLLVEPADSRLDAPGPRQLRVVATFSDGRTRDVTRLASFKVNDDSAVEVSPEGSARLLRRAEADLIVRYGSEVVATRLATIINPALAFDFAKLPRRNVIDVELFKRLESLKVPPSPPANDAAWLRRVTLDLTAQQPDSWQVREFLKDTDPDKREKKVEELLKSADFVSFWEIKLGDLLQISQARFGNGSDPYKVWMKHRLEQNTPWDQVVRELLTSLGDPYDKATGGPVNYAADGMYDPKVAAEQTAQRFLGLRLRCAQCHDHPFDVWTQDDYFGLAAIFAKVGPSGNYRNQPAGAMMGRLKIGVLPDGTVEHLRTKKPAEMRLLDGSPVKVSKDEDPRKALADWMTRPENPYFARATVNWAWAQFFGPRTGRAGRRPQPGEPTRSPRAARRAGQALRRAQVRRSRPDPNDRDERGVWPLLGDLAGERRGYPLLLAPPAPPADGPPDGRRPGHGDRLRASLRPAWQEEGDRGLRPERAERPAGHVRPVSEDQLLLPGGHAVAQPPPGPPADRRRRGRQQGHRASTATSRTSWSRTPSRATWWNSCT